MVMCGSDPTEQTVEQLANNAVRDVIIDGGNSYFKDDVRAPSNRKKRVFITWMWHQWRVWGWNAATA